jgi:hypothetical protein
LGRRRDAEIGQSEISPFPDATKLPRGGEEQMFGAE